MSSSFNHEQPVQIFANPVDYRCWEKLHYCVPAPHRGHGGADEQGEPGKPALIVKNIRNVWMWL